MKKFKSLSKKMKIIVVSVVVLLFVVIGVSGQKNTSDKTVKQDTKQQTQTETKTETENKQTETVSQKNSVNKAKQYLSFSAFSEQGLMKQLEFDKFSKEDIDYAMKNIKVDWNEQAVKKGKAYLDMTAFSKDGLIKQLEFDGFTHEQALHSVSKNGL